MLLKRQKTKKTKDPQQLNLVDSLDEEKKIKRRRLVLIIALSLTLGLSVIFWTYFKIKTIITTHQYPHLSLSLPQNQSIPDLNVSLHQLLSTDSSNWSIYIKNITQSKDILSYNLSSPPKFNPALNQSTETDTLKIFSLLPSGVNYKLQTVSTSPLTVNFLIIVPKFTLFGSITTKSAQSAALLPKVIEAVYWGSFNY